ncbi:SulP family sulfate permease [Palleronia aestuarii]|uniref:SulP family sulfate permease n=1 Tax=Palleronia aestuarii TaxID=568105 RepID=A0A2W7MZ75_9RHOB|nr:SulP family inorganic anion transporter [Palleronia aestuarii]PZX12981.1 SulP family sulfate permease [Palleronia aestuarii]
MRFAPSDLAPPWLLEYNAAALGRDALAGAVLSVLLVPQAMAYAQLAGLSPGMGLTTAMVAPLVYALIGQSASVSMGPVALASLLVAGALVDIDIDPAVAASIVAIEAGAMLTLLAVFRMGRLVNFISEPALLGFTAAAAVLIAGSQFPGLAGIDAERSGTLQDALIAIWEAGRPDWWALILGLCALAGFVMGEAIMRRVALVLRQTGTARLALMKSASLVVILLASLAALALPQVPRISVPEAALPGLVLPLAPPPVWIALLVPSLTVAIVVFVTGIAVVKSMTARRRQTVRSNGEAAAIGIASLACGVTGGYAPGVSLSRSALVHDVGTNSPLASAMAALIVLPVTLFGGALLSQLPVTVLSALVISAVAGLIRWSDIREVAAHSRLETGVIAATFLATLFLGVKWGLLAGAVSGVMSFLWTSSVPRVTREGPDPSAGQGIYRSVTRDGVDADTGHLLVVRIDRPLYFGNTGYAEEQVTRIVAEHPEAECLVLDMRAVTAVDATGLRMLTRLLDGIEEKNLEIYFASLQRPVAEALADQRHFARLEHFDTVGAAAAAFLSGHGSKLCLAPPTVTE